MAHRLSDLVCLKLHKLAILIRQLITEVIDTLVSCLKVRLNLCTYNQDIQRSHSTHDYIQQQ
ncbi:hypothetical protein DPMN_145322 [Dreissena polymorpha]|uniref:Uncharacterized protein n=1 Tax=Dreissena polymorpha TaxID=45954 RepID=A0A9D4F4W6_DREPO|nr:hypothetical protein DPMN_145322 [Dreissena polymorpha]